MAAAADEARFVQELEGKGRLARYGAYLRRGGPGYLQSAMTLGGGTAASSLFAGRMFGYELLWVAPAGMLLGVLLLAVLGRLSLEDEERPYAAMARAAGRWVAVAWAIGALVASIIWHFPQYALAGAALEDIGAATGTASVAGLAVTPVTGAFAVLAVALVASFLYGRTPRLARAYERFVQLLVMGVIACFGYVVLASAGDIPWGEVARGFVPHLPEPRGGQDPVVLVASGLGAAVGINMVLLYPYSLRARGWGKGHVECARFDLFAGMLVPYTIATSLVLIATATTIPWIEGSGAPQKLEPVLAARAFGEVLGETSGRLVFDLGLVGMALSTIALHMLASGFAVAEMTGAGPRSLAYRLGTLLPVPGVLGPMIWKQHLLWLAVPTNIVCGLFLPITYLGVILWARRAPRPSPAPVLAAMALATVVLTAVLGYGLAVKLGLLS